MTNADAEVLVTHADIVAGRIEFLPGRFVTLDPNIHAGDTLLVPFWAGKAEVDPNGKQANEAGAKLDAGKPDLSLLLLFGRALRAVGAVGTFGATKYTRGGWQEVPNGQERYTAAMLRHVLKEQEEFMDAEIGQPHAAAVAWNALARLELMLREQENNNESN